MTAAARLEQLAEQHDLSYLRGRALDVLESLADLGPSTVVEIAEHTGRTPNNVGGALRRLLARRLVRRTDARRVYDSLGRRVPVWSLHADAARRRTAASSRPEVPCPTDPAIAS